MMFCLGATVGRRIGDPYLMRHLAAKSADSMFMIQKRSLRQRPQRQPRRYPQANRGGHPRSAHGQLEVRIKGGKGKIMFSNCLNFNLKSFCCKQTSVCAFICFGPLSTTPFQDPFCGDIYCPSCRVTEKKTLSNTNVAGIRTLMSSCRFCHPLRLPFRTIEIHVTSCSIKRDANI
jgi:hypothetical protein